MTHRVVLSNGRALIIQEGEDALHIADEENGVEGEPYTFICEISASGVLVMPNSCDAGEYLVRNLDWSKT